LNTARYIDDSDPLAMGIILPGETGTVWWNQVGGVTCQHLGWEGDWVPLGTTPGWLIDWFLDAHCGWATQGSFNEEIAKGIEKALRGDLGVAWVKLDRARIRDSLEGWAHVVVGSNSHPVLHSHSGARAILAWKNCD
jgi:hypothetical protein